MQQILSSIRALVKEIRDRQQLRALLAKDDRILRDVGLTREDIEIALGKPFKIHARDEAVRLSRASFSLDHAI